MKKKKKKKKKNRILSFGLAVCCFVGLLGINTQKVKAAEYWPQDPETESPNAIVMEESTGTVLYDKNSTEQHCPASITKIMTTLLALENCSLDETVTFSKEAVYNTHGSGISRDVGEQMTMEECLYAVMLESANECAYAVAEHVGGTVENFVQMMNDKAASLAMTGTHFANPHGLHDENHYTTAYDVYLMLYAAYQHTEFQNTMSMSSYTLNMTHADGTAGTIYLSSTDKYLTGEKNAPENVTVLGGKTGTTDEAGSCLALVSQNAYGEPFISVILHASTKVELYEDMNTLLSNINS